jgi:hypothetical protein
MMIGERKLAVKNLVKSQTTLCQDPPMNQAAGHNKIEIKIQKMVFPSKLDLVRGSVLKEE